MARVLITGANRGIGLALARHYAADGWHVHATCRDPDKAEALGALAGDRLSVHRLDVTDAASVAACAAEIGDVAIDLLINNAGVSGGTATGLADIDYARWAHTIDVNTFGPTRVAQAFVEPLAASERRLLVNISSRLGSMAENTEGGSYVYRSSKAALNAVIRSLAIDLAPRGIVVVALHPGWVATDMGGAEAPIGPDESVAGMRRVIAGLGSADSGRFYAYDGREIPW